MGGLTPELCNSFPRCISWANWTADLCLVRGCVFGKEEALLPSQKTSTLWHLPCKDPKQFQPCDHAFVWVLQVARARVQLTLCVVRALEVRPLFFWRIELRMWSQRTLWENLFKAKHTWLSAAYNKRKSCLVLGFHTCILAQSAPCVPFHCTCFPCVALGICPSGLMSGLHFWFNVLWSKMHRSRKLHRSPKMRRSPKIHRHQKYTGH